MLLLSGKNLVGKSSDFEVHSFANWEPVLDRSKCCTPFSRTVYAVELICYREIVLSGQNLWATVLFSTPAFTWTRASMFTIRLTIRRTIPANPRQTIL